MNSYTEMKARHQAEFNALPLGFAFNEEQLAEMLEKWGLHRNNCSCKICYLGCGTYIQKKDKGRLDKTLERHRKELLGAIVADSTGDGFVFQMFLTELENHEYSYTRDISDALSALGLTSEAVISDPKLAKGLVKACEYIENHEN